MTYPISQHTINIPEECPICFDPANTHLLAKILHKNDLANRVHHYMCSICLGKWLFPDSSQINTHPRTCPTCRGEIAAIHLLKEGIIFHVQESLAVQSNSRLINNCIKIGFFAVTAITLTLILKDY